MVGVVHHFVVDFHLFIIGLGHFGSLVDLQQPGMEGVVDEIVQPEQLERHLGMVFGLQADVGLDGHRQVKQAPVHPSHQESIFVPPPESGQFVPVKRMGLVDPRIQVETRQVPLFGLYIGEVERLLGVNAFQIPVHEEVTQVIVTDDQQIDPEIYLPSVDQVRVRQVFLYDLEFVRVASDDVIVILGQFQSQFALLPIFEYVYVAFSVLTFEQFEVVWISDYERFRHNFLGAIASVGLFQDRPEFGFADYVIATGDPKHRLGPARQFELGELLFDAVVTAR